MILIVCGIVRKEYKVHNFVVHKVVNFMKNIVSLHLENQYSQDDEKGFCIWCCR